MIPAIKIVVTITTNTITTNSPFVKNLVDTVQLKESDLIDQTIPTSTMNVSTYPTTNNNSDVVKFKHVDSKLCNIQRCVNNFTQHQYGEISSNGHSRMTRTSISIRELLNPITDLENTNFKP